MDIAKISRYVAWAILVSLAIAGVLFSGYLLGPAEDAGTWPHFLWKTAFVLAGLLLFAAAGYLYWVIRDLDSLAPPAELQIRIQKAEEGAPAVTLRRPEAQQGFDNI